MTPPPPLPVVQGRAMVCFGCDQAIMAAGDVGGLMVCCWCLRRWAKLVELADPLELADPGSASVNEQNAERASMQRRILSAQRPPPLDAPRPPRRRQP